MSAGYRYEAVDLWMGDAMEATAGTDFRRPGVLARIVAADIRVLYLLLGFLGVIPLVVLTPPFQVPDEPQHFFRAYQISEFDLRNVLENGAAGAVLPSALPELAERFLGTRAIHHSRYVEPAPLLKTLDALDIPLEPTRREFVDFSGAATYWPLAYLPQVVAIQLGRSVGLGPLGLLYAARLANGLVAVLLVAAAIRILPVGKVALLVVGLLPMVLFEFASVSPDAAVISTAFLFTSMALRARFCGHWSGKDVLLACLLAVVFCPLKPVYAPLLVVGLPGSLLRGAWRHALTVHAAMIAVVFTVTMLWASLGVGTIVLPRTGTNLSQQVAGILANPEVFAITVLRTVLYDWVFWILGFVGYLGWLNVRMPNFMYVMPGIALLGCLFLRRPEEPRIGLAEAIWQLLLLGASALLVILALYLYWTPVGQNVIEGVQGRYFLPLAALAAVAFCSLMPLQPPRLARILTLLVLLMTASEVVLTSMLIAHRYQVF